jgi:hypothetical protein
VRFHPWPLIGLLACQRTTAASTNNTVDASTEPRVWLAPTASVGGATAVWKDAEGEIDLPCGLYAGEVHLKTTIQHDSGGDAGFFDTTFRFAMDTHGALTVLEGSNSFGTVDPMRDLPGVTDVERAEPSIQAAPGLIRAKQGVHYETRSKSPHDLSVTLTVRAPPNAETACTWIGAPGVSGVVLDITPGTTALTPEQRRQVMVLANPAMGGSSDDVEFDDLRKGKSRIFFRTPDPQSQTARARSDAIRRALVDATKAVSPPVPIRLELAEMSSADAGARDRTEVVMITGR